MHANYASLLYHRIDCDSLHYTYRDSFYCTRKYDAKHRFLEASRTHTHSRCNSRRDTHSILRNSEYGDFASALFHQSEKSGQLRSYWLILSRFDIRRYFARHSRKLIPLVTYSARINQRETH